MEDIYYEESLICEKCGEEFEDYGDIVFINDDKPLCSKCGWGVHPDQIHFEFE